jgi:hypothetical protein
MDATVGPIALTNHNNDGTHVSGADNSNGSSSNPGTPSQ